MKLTIIATCLTLTCRTAFAATDIPATVTAIDKYADLTDRNLPRMVSRAKEIVTGTDAGGELRAFSSDNHVRKLLLKIGLSNRNVERHFYYRREQLVLIIDRELFCKFNEQAGTFDRSQLEGRHEERYYFADGKVHYVISRSDAGACSREEQDRKRIADLKALSGKLLEVSSSNEETIDLERYFKSGKE